MRRSKGDEVRESLPKLKAVSATGRLPRLRFSEFRNINTWKIRVLSEVLIEHERKSTGNEEVYSVSVHKGIINQIDHLGRSFAAANTDKYNLVLPGDIVYTKSPTGNYPFGIIKQNKNNKPVIVSPLYGVFTPETISLGVILDAFFESSIQTTNYLAPIVQKGAKNTINITNDRFLSQSLNLPIDKKEQQKIAACISALDDLIAAHARKLETLKRYKKCLMQQLLPAGGETVPRLRFPEFKNEGEWIPIKFGEMCSFIRGPFGGSLKKEIFVNEGYAVYEQSHAIYADFSVFRYHIDEDKYYELKRFSVKQDDLIMSCSGTMGRFSIIPKGAPKGVINQALLKLTVKNEKDSRFIKVFLEFPPNLEKILSQSAGGAIQNVVSVDQMKEIDYLIPSLPEQQKIAAVLSSIDDLISAQATKLKQLKKHKRGLMQGLFPAPEEET
jgi:type I restriction enzyme, S subunit